MKSEHIEQLRKIHEQLGQIISEAEAELELSEDREVPGAPPEDLDIDAMRKELRKSDS